MENEIWKDIFPFKGDYQVSNEGRIKSVGRFVKSKNGSLKYNKETIKVPVVSNAGYYRVGIRGKLYSVHRLVAIAFLENPDGKEQVNHIDGCKTNNHLSNLEWNNRSENQLHSSRVLGKNVARIWLGKRGAESPKSKSVIIYRDGQLIEKVESAVIASQRTNTTHSKVCAVCRGELKETKGYVFRYN